MDVRLTALSPVWSSPHQMAVIYPALVALGLTAVIGLERELRAKSAGLRTHTLVGFGAAIFMIVSKYGFGDLTQIPGVSLDPSRIAAQVVSGIGFIGGGLIFVRSDIVRGLTTAATVWLAAAVGMAAGAGLVPLAVGGTVGHLLITVGFWPLARLLGRRRAEPSVVYLSYAVGRGTLRHALARCTDDGWVVGRLEIRRELPRIGVAASTAAVALQLRGKGDLAGLVESLAEIEGVREARLGRRTELATPAGRGSS